MLKVFYSDAYKFQAKERFHRRKNDSKQITIIEITNPDTIDSIIKKKLEEKEESCLFV